MKKLLSVLLCVVMLVSMLTACGSSNGGSGDTKAPETSGESTGGETTGDTKAASTGKEIVYWSMWSSTEPQAKVIMEAAEAYEAKTGVHVKIEWKNRDIQQLIQAALDSKTNIDLFDEDFQRICTQYAKDCLDLDEMAKAVDYESYCVAAFPNTIREWTGGTLKTIAYQPYTSGIFYSKEAFETAGIEKEPQTWAEFLDVCQKLKDAGYTPLAQDDAYVEYTFGFHLARYIGEAAVKDVVKNGDWAENDAVLKAAKDIQTLRENGYLSDTAPDAYPAGENEVGLGVAGMVVNASWVPGEIENNMKEGGDSEFTMEWGMFNYPSVDGGKDPATIANVGAQGFAIPAYSENAQEAFDFIMMLTSGEYDQKMAMESSSMPADTRNTEWPEKLSCCKDAFNALTGVYEWNMGLNEATNLNLKEVLHDNLLKLFEGKLDAQGFVDAMESASAK